MLANFPSKGYARYLKAMFRIIKEPIASAEVSWLGRGRDGEASAVKGHPGEQRCSPNLAEM